KKLDRNCDAEQQESGRQTAALNGILHSYPGSMLTREVRSVKKILSRCFGSSGEVSSTSRRSQSGVRDVVDSARCTARSAESHIGRDLPGARTATWIWYMSHLKPCVHEVVLAK